jgi:hypothetical protein
MSDQTPSITLALSALRRAQAVLHDLDHTRQVADLQQVASAARHEVDSALGNLESYLAAATEDREGVVAARHHETSAEAARKITLATGQQRHRILTALFHDGPLTDFELQNSLAIRPSSERPRRGELVNGGYVQAVLAEDGKVQTRRHVMTGDGVLRSEDGSSGTAWTLWEITEAGRAAILRIGEQQALPV